MVKMIKLVLLLLLTSSCLGQSWRYYPEDYSSYFHTVYSPNEYFIASFYPNEANRVIQDLRLGLNKYPLSTRGLLTNDCNSQPIIISTKLTLDEKPDTEWTPLTFLTQSPSALAQVLPYYANTDKYNMDVSFLDPALLGRKYPQLADYQVSSAFLSQENYRLNYYLFFGDFNSNANEITIQCSSNCNLNGNELNIGHVFNMNCIDLVVFQSFMRSNSNYFSKFGETGISCPGKKVVIYNKANMRFNIGEIRLTIAFDQLSASQCALPADCPPGTYCDASLKKCVECSGKAATCTSKDVITNCSRFMKEWNEDQPSTCTPEYVNLNQFDSFGFDLKPIKTGTATMSLWFYLTEIKQSSNSREAIVHFVLSDYFLVSILINSAFNYEVYFTAYHLYHKVYGSSLEDTTRASVFLSAIQAAPYNSWYIKQQIPLKNRWLYGQFAINHFTHKMELLLSSLKARGSFAFSGSLELPYEYINSLLTQQSSVPFVKFYRDNDSISLRVKNLKSFSANNHPLYLKNLYVFAGFIPGDSTVTNGFQYYNLHRIIQSDLTFPEFVFSCGFDHFIEEDDGSYAVEYSHPTASVKTLNIGKPSNDALVYSYTNKLYRLHLISEKNKLFKDNNLALEAISACSNGALCFDTNKAFACNDNYYLNPKTMNCEDRCFDGFNIGIGLSSHKKGLCFEVCPSAVCKTVKCSTLASTDPNYCDPALFPFTIQCINANLYFLLNGKCYPKNNGQFYDQSRGSMHYSHFYNLPPISITLPSTIASYYLSFWFMLETNSVLYPTASKSYFFMTDTFKLLHNKELTVFGVEGNDEIVSDNFIGLIDKFNWNKFTIAADPDESNRSLIYINNQFNSPFYFGVSTNLNSIHFCHLDAKCNAKEGSQITWSGGYYKHIHIFNKDRYPFLSINHLKTFANYESTSTAMSIKLNKPPDDFTSPYITINIPLTYKTIDRNTLTLLNSSIGSIALSPKKDLNVQQMFNVNDNHDMPIDKRLNHFINRERSFTPCASPPCQSCFGQSLPGFDKCITCAADYHFLDGKCKPYESSNKSYWALILPIKRGNKQIQMGAAASNPKLATISFWLKLFGMSSSVTVETEIVTFLDISILLTKDYKVICRYNNTLSFDFATFDYSHLLGKYVHFSLALNVDMTNRRTTITDVTIDKERVPTLAFTPMSFGISMLYLSFGTEVYAFITRLSFYSNFILGLYGINTNKDFILDQSSLNYTMTKINEDNEDCVEPNIPCIKDYDPILDKSNYPSIRQTFIQEGWEYKAVPCHRSCSLYCFNGDEGSCTCSADSVHYYQLIDEYGLLRCKKKAILDLQRYRSITFRGLSCSGLVEPAIEFWLVMYVYDYKLQGSIINIIWSDLFDLLVQYDSDSTQFNIQCHRTLNSDKAVYKIGVWTRVVCQYQGDTLTLLLDNIQKSSSSITKPSCTGSELKLILQKDRLAHDFDFSWGTAFIRQFRIWSNAVSNKYQNIALVNKWYLEPNIKVIIDPIYDAEEKFRIYLPNDNSISHSRTTLQGGYNSFSYDPKPYDYYETINLCDENAECLKLLNVNELSALSYSEVLPSITNRYSLELWIKVEDSNKLIRGISFVWENHMAVSIIKGQNEDKGIIFCFPQGYRDNPKGLWGEDIKSKAAHSLNSLKREENISNQWIYIRCAYSWDMEEYYLQFNDNHEVSPIKKEMTYDGKTFDFPLKYYHDEQKTALSLFSIELPSQRDKTQILIRVVNLYSEYLPFIYSTARILFEFSHKVQYLSLGINFEVNDDISIDAFDQSKAFKIALSSLLLSNEAYAVYGGINICKVALEYYDKAAKSCKPITSQSCSTPPHSLLSFDCSPLECEAEFYLDLGKIPFECSAFSGNTIRSPGSSIESSICNYDCSGRNLSCQSNSDFPNTLQCKPEYTRVGYKCLPTSLQPQTAFYFNHCLNFLPLYTQFDAELKASLTGGYYLEVWFKLDHLNDFCKSQSGSRSRDRHILWAYPHVVYFKAFTDDVYYSNAAIAGFVPQRLQAVQLFEWNVLIIKHQGGKTTLLLNLDFDTPAYEYNNAHALVIEAIAFCTGTHQCSPLNTPLRLTWANAFYKKMKIYLADKLNEETVIEYIVGNLAAPIEGIVIHYLFDNIENQFNVIKNLIGNSNDLDVHSSISSNSRYQHPDKMLLLMSSSSFDWAYDNNGHYVTGIDPSTGVIQSAQCYSNCLRCFSPSPDDCYACKQGYKIIDKQCKLLEQYHFIIQHVLQSPLVLSFNNEVTLEHVNPITVSLWFKYYGLQSSVKESSEQCVLLMQFSQRHDFFFCIDKTSKHLKMFIKQALINDDGSFSSLIGKWINLSISNYMAEHSKDSFPFMFSLSFNGNIVPINLSLIAQQSQQGVAIDQIAFGTSVIFQLAHLLIYSAYIHNPFGVITNSIAQLNSLVIYVSFIGNSPSSCIEETTFTTDITSIASCIQDENSFLTEALKCPKGNSFFDGTECHQCSSACTHCYGIASDDCSCFNNEKQLLVKRPSSLDVHCESIEYQNFLPFSRVEFTGIPSASQEYTIDLWIRIDAYKHNDISFLNHEIHWSNHMAIIASHRAHLSIQCIPKHKDVNTQLDLTDDSLNYFKWNHIICSVSIPLARFYLNKVPFKVLTPLRSETQATSTLTFSSENSFLNNGLVFIRHIKLYSFYKIINLFQDCKYNEAAPEEGLLSSFEFNKGSFKDSNGKEASTITKRTNYYGYNIIEDYDPLPFVLELDDCFNLYAIPSRGVFNQTHFLFFTDFSAPSGMYDFYYSVNGINYYLLHSSPEMELLHLFTAEAFENTQTIIEVRVIDLNGKERKASTAVDILPHDSLSAKDIDYSVYAKLLNDFPDTGFIPTQSQILNRITVLNSLIITPSFPDLIKTTQASFNSVIVITNPICSADFCSGHGICFIVIRSLTCQCQEGFFGANCHIAKKSKGFFLDMNAKYWDLLTNGKNYSLMLITNEVVHSIERMVKNVISFNESDSPFIIDFYAFLKAYVHSSALNSIDSFGSLLETINLIIEKHYAEINSLRALSFNQLTNSTDVLTPEQIARFASSEKAIHEAMTSIISKHLSIFSTDLSLDYSGYSLTIQTVSKGFDYETYFSHHKEAYLPYFNGGKCSDEVIAQAASAVFFVMIYYISPPNFYHSIYLNSSSYSIDVFYANKQGVTLPVKTCKEPIELFFPVILYNTTLVQFIQDNKKQINVDLDKIDPADPYLTSPAFINSTGEVSTKTLEERRREFFVSFSIDCSYWNPFKLTYTSEGKGRLTENYFLQCKVYHLSQFSTMTNSSELISLQTEGLFFYTAYPQVFSLASNYVNFSFIALTILLCCFFIILATLGCLSHKNLNADIFVESVKREIILQQRLVYSAKDIDLELDHINRLKINNCFTKLSRNENTREKTISCYIKKTKSNEQSRKIISDLHPPASRLRFGSSRNVVVPKNILVKKKKLPKKYVAEEYDNFQNSSARKHIEISIPKIENNDEEEMIDSELRDNMDFSSDVVIEEETSPQSGKRFKSQSQDVVIYSLVSPKYFSSKKLPKYSSNNSSDVFALDGESRGRRGVHLKKKISYISVPKIKYTNGNVSPISRNERKSVPVIPFHNLIMSFYEHLNSKPACFSTFYKHITFKRNFFISPFYLHSLFIVSLRRFILLFTFIFLLFFYSAILLTLVDRLDVTPAQKVCGISFIVLVLSHLSLVPFSSLLCFDRKDKLYFFELLRKDEHLKLHSEWDKVNKREKLNLAAGFCLSIGVFAVSLYFCFNCSVVLYWNSVVLPFMLVFSLAVDFIAEMLINCFVSWAFVKWKQRKLSDSILRLMIEWRNFHCCV